YATRPHAINQYSLAIGIAGVVVGPLEANIDVAHGDAPLPHVCCQHTPDHALPATARSPTRTPKRDRMGCHPAQPGCRFPADPSRLHHALATVTAGNN